MTERDPTSGELAIKLDNITTMLRDMREAMATKEFVNTKFDAYNDRVGRLEADVKELNQISTAAHISLEAESKTRHGAAEALARNLHTEVNSRIDALEGEQKAQEQTIKAQRNGRAQAITISLLGAFLAVVGSIVASGVIRSLFPG